jgi:hypothetical protein
MHHHFLTQCRRHDVVATVERWEGKFGHIMAEPLERPSSRAGRTEEDMKTDLVPPGPVQRLVRRSLFYLMSE